jgi:hypothetical protein
MKQEQFPFGEHVQLTPEVLDFYIARARKERAKAIEEFGGRVAAWVAATIARLAGREHKARSHRVAGSSTS